MTDRQHGIADNYAGVPRTRCKPAEWLAGWDEAEQQRLNDEREIRTITHQLQLPQSVRRAPRAN